MSNMDNPLFLTEPNSKSHQTAIMSVLNRPKANRKSKWNEMMGGDHLSMSGGIHVAM